MALYSVKDNPDRLGVCGRWPLTFPLAKTVSIGTAAGCAMISIAYEDEAYNKQKPRDGEHKN